MAPIVASGECQRKNRNGESLLGQEDSAPGAPRQGRAPRVRVDRPLLGRTARLLNMLYRPSELAEELKVNVQVIYRQWVPAGLPHSSADGHLWINGREARDWLARQRRTGQGPKLQDHEAYCVHKGSGRLDQIQLTLGHASIRTTGKYLGITQDLQDAPCDHLGPRLN